MSAQLRAALVAEALCWISTPYHHGQRVRGAGVDCAQFVAAVFEAVGIVEPIDAGSYSRDWMFHRNDERVLAEVLRHAVRELGPQDVPQAGDVVAYRVGRAFAHVAIVTDWPLVIHACAKVGEVTLSEHGEGRLAAPARVFSVFRD